MQNYSFRLLRETILRPVLVVIEVVNLKQKHRPNVVKRALPIAKFNG